MRLLAKLPTGKEILSSWLIAWPLVSRACITWASQSDVLLRSWPTSCLYPDPDLPCLPLQHFLPVFLSTVASCCCQMTNCWQEYPWNTAGSGQRRWHRPLAAEQLMACHICLLLKAQESESASASEHCLGKPECCHSATGQCWPRVFGSHVLVGLAIATTFSCPTPQWAPHPLWKPDKVENRNHCFWEMLCMS